MDSTNDSGFFDFVLEIPVLPTVPKNVSKVNSTSGNSSASNLTTFKNHDQNSENIDQNSENKEQKSENNEQNYENKEHKSENKEDNSENEGQNPDNKEHNLESKSNEQNSKKKEQNFKDKEQNFENNEQNSGNNKLNCPFCQEEQSLDAHHKCEKYQNALSQKNCSLCHLSVEEGFMKKHLEFDCKITKLFGVKKALSFQTGNSALKSEILQNYEESKSLQNSEKSELLQNSSESSNPPPLVIKEVYSLGTVHILRNHF